MCEANVFIEKDGELKSVMENVVSITPVNDKLLLVDLFGEQKQIRANFKEVKLLEHQVILSPKE
jgi:predicted RNA-binding protein